MRLTLIFMLINVGALSFVQSTGEIVTPHASVGKLNINDPEKKEKSFFGDDSLNFGYASAKLSFGGGINGYNGLGFGGYYRPSLYGPYVGGSFHGGGGFQGGFGSFGIGFPYKYHHHHHHRFHHGFGGYHQPYFPPSYGYF